MVGYKMAKFENKMRAKLLYKNAIKHPQIGKQSEISNSLNNALCNEDSTSGKCKKISLRRKMYS